MKSSKFRFCGVCCGILSIWGVLQLGIMGLCFYYETFPFLEEAIEYDHRVDFEDVDKFVEHTKGNYRKIAMNCWFAAGIYCFTLILSMICIGIAKARTKTVFTTKDEDLLCSTEAEKFTRVSTLGLVDKEKAGMLKKQEKSQKKKEQKEEKNKAKKAK